MSKDEGIMADPYASGASPPPASSLPSFGGFTLPPPEPAVPAAAQPDYLFTENYDAAYRRSWGERLTFHIGAAYLAGLSTGGTYGMFQGLRGTVGERRRIRINSVLNGVGRSGPLWGNSLGCIAMMCSIFESAAFNFRETDDLLNPVGAACATGVIYKITAGPRIALSAGLGLGAMAAAGSFVTKSASSRGMLKNFL